MKINIQKIKVLLSKSPRIKSLLKKVIISYPPLRRFIVDRYGVLKAIPQAVTDERIRLQLCQDEQKLSTRALKIYKDISCLKKENR
ncbi:hypothetical protein [Sulfurimonas sp.]|uniref:hypothetical protein n=1 Tax=Sulfurimonas sp. TaxID=2022749 RepID=UPI0025F49D02|nr:hypothetical protein [Sulfurimonas sp.]MCK9474030.1 hypothetical protein [Sulfurimonas sp.]